MNPTGTPEIMPFPKGDAPIVATHLTVVCHCSDGKLRAIKFEGKQAKKVYGYVEHIQGGRVKMKKEPLLLLNDFPIVRQSIEAAVNPPVKHSWWRDAANRVRRFQSPPLIDLPTEMQP